MRSILPWNGTDMHWLDKWINWSPCQCLRKTMKKTGGASQRYQRSSKVFDWLVVSTLWTILISWDYSSQYMETWTLFQTTNQLTIKGLNQRPHTHSTVTFEWVTNWLLQTSPRSFRLDTGQKVPLKDHCFWSEPFRPSSSRWDWS